MMRRGEREDRGGRRSSRAGKVCEARERANRGPCFTNCHLREANGGMRGGKKKYNNHRPAPDCTQREMYSDTSEHCIMHTWVNSHAHTRLIQEQVDRKHR